MLAKLRGSPQRMAKRSLTPPPHNNSNGTNRTAQAPQQATALPRTSGSGMSSSTAVSRSSGTRNLSAAHTRSGASAGSGQKGTGDGRTGAQRGAHTGAGPGAADGPARRGGGGGAELRSPGSEASLERMDSGSAHVKLLGASHSLAHCACACSASLACTHGDGGAVDSSSCTNYTWHGTCKCASSSARSPSQHPSLRRCALHVLQEYT